MATHSGDKKYACQHCDYKSVRKSGLKKHVDQVHNTLDLMRCGLCNFATINKVKYRSHVIAHEANKVYTCTACDKTFWVKNDYSTHMVQVHKPKTKEKEYPCSLCALRFSALKDRIHHMSQEHGMLGHKCRLCGSIYSRFSELRKHHRKKHSEEPIYHCHFCHFNSNESREYRVHLTSVAHLE